MGGTVTVGFGGAQNADVAWGRVDSTFMLTIHLTGPVFKEVHFLAGDSLLIAFDDGAGLWITAFNADASRAMAMVPGSHAISCQYLVMGDGAKLFAERTVLGLRFQPGGRWWEGLVSSEFDKKRLKRAAQCVLEASKP